MTPRQLKRLALREDVHAHIISDGCRDYVVEIIAENGAGLLRRRGQPLRFRSLSEAQGRLKKCRVSRAVLRHRVAHDEACTFPYEIARYDDLPLTMTG
ncbi:MAG: DUF6482 family protein [Pseudomonadaceae bacterium]|nr:DUF6482 family protein [Pseudomonadaceae bacterium]